jgi:branched-chain amino acid transport system substrate-binding protein
VHAVAADVMGAGRPMLFGGTDPRLTQMGNPWLFRCRPNDTYSARVIAEFGMNVLGATRWAIVYIEDQFGTSGRDALTRELKRRGVEPVVTRGLAGGAQDATPLVQAVSDAGADLIASYFLRDGFAVFARQLRQAGVGTAWIGSSSITVAGVQERAGPALHGAYAVTDFAAGSGPAAEAFARKYEAAYNEAPDYLSAWTFDAMNLLARAATEAGGTEPDRIRAALLAIRGYQGAEGTYSFDRNGDGLRGYNVVRNEGGKWVFARRIEFQD